ncbi:hypothetical protein FOL47_003604 [Perkinsus chesapeaki]|uniref:NF-kappa-B-activating protein C-terminal domain-containing protein n=1 Tax=Perkinsus chesapeaki TaxID=330153 RepID=A0A7J6M798_PERCH|nr:hypothetical protein FOL47_003604 [Perkinsus chesapeaki]
MGGYRDDGYRRRRDEFGRDRRGDERQHRIGGEGGPDRAWLEKRMKDRWEACSSREIADMILTEDRTQVKNSSRAEDMDSEEALKIDIRKTQEEKDREERFHTAVQRAMDPDYVSPRKRKSGDDSSGSESSDSERHHHRSRHHHRKDRERKRRRHEKKKDKKHHRRRRERSPSSDSLSSESSDVEEVSVLPEPSSSEYYTESAEQSVEMPAAAAAALEPSSEESDEDDDEGFGPRPMLSSSDVLGGTRPHGGGLDYGKALRPGEGEAMASYVAEGKRIPRRGEVGMSTDEIEKMESVGYVMSGSRHRRMNAVRIRKENQVYSAEEKRALALYKFEEKAEREAQTFMDMLKKQKEQLEKGGGLLETTGNKFTSKGEQSQFM